jgi:hypothetical protein
VLGAQPEQSLDHHSGLRRRLGIEMVAEVDQCRRLAAAGRRRQGREHQREAPAGAPPDHLDRLAALEAAIEQPVDGIDPGGEALLASLGGRGRGDQPARAEDQVFEGRPGGFGGPRRFRPRQLLQLAFRVEAVDADQVLNRVCHGRSAVLGIVSGEMIRGVNKA